MNRVFADTSYWFSLAVRADINHDRTLALTRRLQTDGVLLYLSVLIAAETHRLILHKLGIEAGRRFIDQLSLQVGRGFVIVLPVTWETTIEARQTMEKYDDQDITLTDATSAVLMRRNRIETVAGYDRHFEMMGFARMPLETM